MASISIENVILDGKSTCVRIEGNRFASVGAPAAPADTVIDCRGAMAIVPPFYNAHNHAAMTLFRGYADDLELFTWLNDYIWPAEARLDAEDILIGAKLAIVEMIKSGTVFFNDMYWQPKSTLRAALEMKVRAAVGLMTICGPDGEQLPQCRRDNQDLLELRGELPERLIINHAPHAVYTVNGDNLRRIVAEADSQGIDIHIHAAETAREVEDCRREHNGLTPIEYLDNLGVIRKNTVLAHCVHLTDRDREIIAERGAVIAHMPVSNLKLCSGMFDFPEALKAGCRVAIGTDGASSNNNLSMLDEMKFAALVAKARGGNPTAGSAAEVLRAATVTGARAFGIDAGVIAAGKLADALLVDLDQPCMVGDYSFTANLVYSADPSVIDTVICDGEILMRHRVIPGEAEIVAAAREVCDKFRRAK